MKGNLYEVEIWYSWSNTTEKHQVVASSWNTAMVIAKYFHMSTSVSSYRSGFNTLDKIELMCKDWVELI